METLSGAQEFLKRVKRWQRIGALTPVGMGGPSRRGDNVGGELCRIGGGSVRKGTCHVGVTVASKTCRMRAECQREACRIGATVSVREVFLTGAAIRE